MSDIAASALAALLVQAETQLDNERTARIELEVRIDALTAEINSMCSMMSEQKPVASAGKKAFNITVTGRDDNQNAKTFRVEQ